MTVRLTLFGTPTIAFGGQSIALRLERRTQLLVYLALKRSWVARAELAALLWPDQDSRLANTNLRKALFRLQGLPGAGGIEVQAGALRFEVRTDVHDFETALRELRFADALALHQSDLLVGFDDDSNEAWSRWMHFERDRLRSAWRAAAAQHLGGEVAGTEAVDLAARLLDADPLDESALRLYVDWLVRSGQVARARQAYNAFVERLRDELGLEPGAELRSLQSVLNTASTVVVRVPEAKVTSVDEGFVGRVVELRRIAALMSQDDCRLLCVIGPGGIGKTSLARRAMDQLASGFADGAVFVPLDDLAAAEELGGRIAHELDIALKGAADPMEQVAAALAGRHMLLVLDNFEQLVEGARRLELLLGACPRLKLIVTSRVRLALASEWLLPLDGLACPEDEDQDRLEAFDAARLFMRAARRVHPDLMATAEASAIVEICRLVEGLPLALELAASWTRVLSCREIATELKHGIELLRAADGAHATRHSSIEAVFDQSWRMLTPSEREVLARLSVFRGGFSVGAARDVTGASLPVLGALTDKSLLHRDSTRLTLHPLVQQLAAARLAEDPQRAATEQAHAHHFHDFLHQLRRPVENGERDALRQLDAEFENCRLAWRWATAHRAKPALASSVYALERYCDHRSRLEEGLSLLRDALACLPEPDDSKLKALLLGKAAHFEYRLHHYADAIAMAMKGLQIAVDKRDVDARAQCLKVLGVCQLRLGKPRDAKRYFEEALKLVPECSEVRLRAGMLTGLALVQKMLGDYEHSQRLSLEALGEDRRLGDTAGEALSLNNLAALHIEREQYPLAGEYLKSALALCDRHGYAETAGAVLANLTAISLKLGDHDAARDYGARALEQAHSAGNRFVIAYLRFQLCRLAVARGDLDAARAEIRAGVELALAVGRPTLLIDSLACLAEILAAQGEAGCARAIANFASNHPLAAPPERDEFQRMLARFPAAEQAERPWPGLTLEEVVHLIAIESEIAYAPLIAVLRGGA